MGRGRPSGLGRPHVSLSHVNLPVIKLIIESVEQPGYSLLARTKVDEEFANAALYTRRGLGLTIFSPLGGGLLTGKYIDGVPDDSRLRVSDDPYIQSVVKGVGSDAWNKQQDSIRKLMKIAEKLDTDVATLSMAWVLTNKNVSSAITGASRPEQIFQTVKAVDVYRKLTPELVEEIENCFENKPKAVMKRFG
jgi:aryl-alcohol dehydrogenase-like predicted oxidoreductase